ncbi:hypothetical protein B5807_08948 [Epicoccum nigrum]|uniref:Uncharacterized protein n=1 Tax=Epicoccum nigrum TaxID=105696 RepID=A0A1Y2LS11_EPING|nr:hypothetical protein B5807_08948 [Epicoccum nigrum]
MYKSRVQIERQAVCIANRAWISRENILQDSSITWAKPHPLASGHAALYTRSKLELTATSTHSSSAPYPNQTPDTDAPASPQTMHTLSLAGPHRPLETHLLRTRRLGGSWTDGCDTLLAHNKPDGAQHTAIWTRIDDGMKSPQAAILDWLLEDGLRVLALVATEIRVGGGGALGLLAVFGGQAAVLVVLEYGDLTAAQDGLKWEADEKLGGRGKEGAERVGCRGDDGVDGEGGAEYEGCRRGDEGRYAGVEQGGREEVRGYGYRGKQREAGIDGARSGGDGGDDQTGADEVEGREDGGSDGRGSDSNAEGHERRGALDDVQAAEAARRCAHGARVRDVEEGGEGAAEPAFGGLEQEVVDEGAVGALPHSPGRLLLPQLGDDLEQRVGALEVQLAGGGLGRPCGRGGARAAVGVALGPLPGRRRARA